MPPAEALAVVETRLVHRTHRAATSLLADAAARPSAPAAELRALRDFLVAALHHHHETEDGLLWPALRTAAPDAAEALDALSHEHDELDAALDALAAAPVPEAGSREELAVAAVAVRDLVHRHLEHEEPILFPALRAHLSEEAWLAFSGKVMAGSPQEGAHLQVGLMQEAGSFEELAAVLAHLPPPLREALPALGAQAQLTLQALRNAKETPV
ncbi:hemerythrin domain-containing protein [Streptomyces sp. NPDC047072]|uniref:hemerythrin domain-containing protein n=1 Tax=Streptomyces sp. NPDC047072 TaxID=3154809 RepID=UPI0033F643F8